MPMTKREHSKIIASFYSVLIFKKKTTKNNDNRGKEAEKMVSDRGQNYSVTR